MSRSNAQLLRNSLAVIRDAAELALSLLPPELAVVADPEVAALLEQLPPGDFVPGEPEPPAPAPQQQAPAAATAAPKPAPPQPQAQAQPPAPEPAPEAAKPDPDFDEPASTDDPEALLTPTERQVLITTVSGLPSAQGAEIVRNFRAAFGLPARAPVAPRIQTAAHGEWLAAAIAALPHE